MAPVARDHGKEVKQIVMQARKIVAYVGRNGAATQLQELIAHDNVLVHKEGKKANDKGVDIQGDVLDLRHFGKDGDILYVYGKAGAAASLKMDELTLVGDKVTINQKENIVEVDGVGSMSMPSNTALDGSKNVKPGSIMTILWNGGMVFDGRHAQFRSREGDVTAGVKAEQDNSKLSCVNLQVTLDKDVSFKDGQKRNQTAKVETLLCDRQVFVLDQTRNLQDRLIKESKASFTQLEQDNGYGITKGSGPGFIAIWDKSGRIADTPGMTTGEPADKMMLTRVEFNGRMFSQVREKENTRLTKFFGDAYRGVEVFHLPTDNPGAPFSRDVPPKGDFFLRCNLLAILTRQIAGKATQVMEADGQVFFRSDEYSGRADKIVFDEAADTVMFIANEGSFVTITETKKGQVNQGRRILYNRHSGEFKIEGSPGLMK